MGTRHRARELALAFLYQSQFHPLEASEELFQLFWAEHPVKPTTRSLAEELIRGTVHHREAIDALITAQVEHWTLSRLALVDLCILRLAVYELLFSTDTPWKVVIDEAIELAKAFGGQDSSAFINGILDKLYTAANRRATIQQDDQASATDTA